MADIGEGEEAAGVETDAAADETSQMIAALDAEKQEANDKLLRLAAEFENYKKRMIRERETAIKYAEEGLLKELLPTLDNLERALAHQNSGDDINVLREGVGMTMKVLMSATAKFGLVAIESVGQPFDPNVHEALAMEESDEVPPQAVIREFEKGYYYKDRLLRAAKVAVAKARE
ncbi:MAG: nucleotide exchange factor GrpE [Proteobacteria bacterium]|nr:nucleotide exchange factor GrpE [Desulfobulbaceae bacterium]MBU4153897.1 nucleotide exchange factor GrpE [Pseudomonadota bacterium]